MKISLQHQSSKKSFLNCLQSLSPAFILVPLFLLDINCKNSNKCFSGTSITIPSSDLTTSTTIMDVHMSNKPITSVTSASSPDSAAIGGNDTVTIIAKGTDPEGIKDIQIWVEETWWNPSITGPTLLSAPEVRNVDNSTAGAKGCTERLATLNLYIKQRRKQATSYRIRTWSTAVNFGGAKVNSAVVTLRWP
ncbi:MAG TPA: hypothetical protein VEV87_08455 [Chitinophagaceae bacterium]|nr:hypothetical protein [Chitinophagaceae bacterium]